MTSDVGSAPLHPPVARVEPHDHTLHGVTRSDPYAWLRDVGSAEVAAHLRAERAWYEAAVRHTAPLADELADAIMARIPATERGVTVDRLRCVYYTERGEGRENGEIRRRPSWIVTESLATDPVGDELVLDLDALRGDSAYVDLGVCEPSPDERLLAYSVDRTGDEVFELRFRDLSTGVDLADLVPHTYYTGAWSAAGDQFFYTVHDEAYRPYQVRRHVLGTDPVTDQVVFDESDAQYEVTVRACRSGGLIVISTENRDTTEQWLVDPAEPAAPPRCVAPRHPGLEYRVEHAPYVDAKGQTVDRMVVLTNHDAPEFRLMTAPTADPGQASWAALTPYDEAERLLEVDAFDGSLVVTLRRDYGPQLRILEPDGSLRHTLEPAPYGHVELAETPRWATPTVVVQRYSHVEPRVWTDVDLLTAGESVKHRETVPAYDRDGYESTGLLVVVRDGTRVPVTLVHRRDVPLNGSAPCLLSGYGAYESVFEPEFDPALIALLDRGVVFAHAGIRGGGEGGRRWWLDGRLDRKHHTFEDHIDVAEALGGLGGHPAVVDRERVATRGLSAGGLLQGAVFSQRPELWRCVVAEVPFVDVVTTMLDASVPLTANEWDEWGDPRRAADFRWMLAYSPYDNPPAPGGRPDLLVTGAVHDARVMVWEPAKWVSRLRAGDPEWGPRCVFRVDTGAGAHTGPSGRYAKARYEAEVLAWLVERLT